MVPRHEGWVDDHGRLGPTRPVISHRSPREPVGFIAAGCTHSVKEGSITGGPVLIRDPSVVDRVIPIPRQGEAVAGYGIQSYRKGSPADRSHHPDFSIGGVKETSAHVAIGGQHRIGGIHRDQRTGPIIGRNPVKLGILPGKEVSTGKGHLIAIGAQVADGIGGDQRSIRAVDHHRRAPAVDVVVGSIAGQSDDRGGASQRQNRVRGNLQWSPGGGADRCRGDGKIGGEASADEIVSGGRHRRRHPVGSRGGGSHRGRSIDRALPARVAEGNPAQQRESCRVGFGRAAVGKAGRGGQG